MLKTLLSGLALALLAAPAAAQQTAAPTIDPKWMTVDSAAKRVTFAVIAGHTPLNGSLNFNGFKDGELTFVVPQGWMVVVNFTNHDGSLPHSVQLIPDRQPLPLRAVDPSIAGAETKNADQGTATGGTHERFQFVANPPGSYILFCAVAGHGMGGMWVRLKIDATARTAAIIATPTAH